MNESRESDPVNFKPRPCAVCGSTEKSLIFRQQFALMSSESLLNGYDVVACRDCGFCFADHLPPQESFDRYYTNMSKYEAPAHGGESPNDSLRFEKMAATIQEFVPRRDTHIVEIGCAAGGLLGRLKTHGYQNIQGVDPGLASAEIASRLYGVSVLTGSLYDELISPGSVELLILVGVLEHLRDLETAVTVLHKLLAPAGKLFVSVPDASRYADGEDAPFQEFSVEHINFFGPQSLANLFARTGLEPAGTKTEFLQVAPRTHTPIVHTVFEKTAEANASNLIRDDLTEAALRRYVEESRREDELIRQKISALTTNGVPVIVWGTGAHTLRLLSGSDLARANIVAFVDSNPYYQGKTLHGKPIITPAELKSRNDRVLISSRAYQSEIADQIRNTLGCSNELVLLYEF